MIHHDSSHNKCEFGSASGAVSAEDNFGHYWATNPSFRCSSSDDSTTNHWFGRRLAWPIVKRSSEDCSRPVTQEISCLGKESASVHATLMSCEADRYRGEDPIVTEAKVSAAVCDTIIAEGGSGCKEPNVNALEPLIAFDSSTIGSGNIQQQSCTVHVQGIYIQHKVGNEGQDFHTNCSIVGNIVRVLTRERMKCAQCASFLTVEGFWLSYCTVKQLLLAVHY